MTDYERVIQKRSYVLVWFNPFRIRSVYSSAFRFLGGSYLPPLGSTGYHIVPLLHPQRCLHVWLLNLSDNCAWKRLFLGSCWLRCLSHIWCGIYSSLVMSLSTIYLLCGNHDPLLSASPWSCTAYRIGAKGIILLVMKNLRNCCRFCISFTISLQFI